MTNQAFFPPFAKNSILQSVEGHQHEQRRRACFPSSTYSIALPAIPFAFSTDLPMFSKKNTLFRAGKGRTGRNTGWSTSPGRPVARDCTSNTIAGRSLQCIDAVDLTDAWAPSTSQPL